MKGFKLNSFIVTLVVSWTMGLAAPSAHADLFVASSQNNAVLRYNETTGAFIDTFALAGSGGLMEPEGLVFGPDGNLYVNSSDGDAVLRYNGTTGDPMPAQGQEGADFVPTGSGGLNGPSFLTFTNTTLRP